MRPHFVTPVTIHVVVGERRTDNIVTVGGIYATPAPASTSTVKGSQDTGRKIFKERDKVEWRERKRKGQNQWAMVGEIERGTLGFRGSRHVDEWGTHQNSTLLK
jgi:hypothetical protein